MKFKELKNKPEEELRRILHDLQVKRQALNFKDANKQLKNVREIRETRTNIAQILTLLKEKQANQEVK